MIADEALAALRSFFPQPSLLAWRALEAPLYQGRSDRLVVDLGAGLGYFTSVVAPAAVAVDFDRRQLVRGRDTGLLERAVVADVAHLPLGSAAIDHMLANCVLEHLVDIDGALDGVVAALRPGGVFEVTVPVDTFNDCLLLPYGWYQRLRNRQLAHRTVLSVDGWADLFMRHGLRVVEHTPVVSVAQGRRWDLLDAPLFLGWGGITWFRAYVHLLARWRGLRVLNSKLASRVALWIMAADDSEAVPVCVYFRLERCSG